jgi:GT2 family glycosyltransferase
MTHRPLVSVLVLHYGDPADTARCLRSLVSDGYSDKEILMLDNDSPVRFPEDAKKEFGDAVRWFFGKNNLGFAGGHDFLAKAAHGEFIAPLNNDAVVRSGWLPPLVSALEDRSVAACQPKMLSLLDPSRFDHAGGCGGFLDAFGYPYTRGGVFNHQEIDAGQYDDAMDIDWASGAAFLIRRELFLSMGGFDERLFAYFEEIDLMWKLRRKGYRLRVVPASVVLHEGAKALAYDVPRKIYLMHRNNLLVLAKNLPLSRSLIVIPARLVLEWAAALFYWCHGYGKCGLMPIRSFFEFFVRSPAFFRERPRDEKAQPYRVMSAIVRHFLLGKRTWNEIEGRTALFLERQRQ